MKTIRFMRRVNLGNYEHEELDITIAIEDSACHIEASQKLRQDAEVALALRKANSAAPVAKKEELPPELPPVIPTEKKATKKVTKKKVVKRAPKPAKEEEKKVVTKKVVKRAPKNIQYNRATDHHKTAFTKLLGELEPTWKTTHLKEAKNASMELVGEDLMDTAGLILDTFKSKLTDLMFSAD